MGQICFEFRIFLDASKVTDYCITWHLKWYMKFWPKIIDCQIFLQQRLVYSGSKGCNSRSVIMVSLLQVLTGKRNAFIEKRELERVILNKKYSAFLWLSLCQEKKWLSSLWALLLLQGVRAPPSGFSSLFNWGLYCINFFTEAAWISNINISAMKYEYWH